MRKKKAYCCSQFFRFLYIFFFFGPVVKQDIRAGTWGERSTHLMVPRKKRGRGLHSSFKVMHPVTQLSSTRSHFLQYHQFPTGPKKGGQTHTTWAFGGHLSKQHLLSLFRSHVYSPVWVEEGVCRQPYIDSGFG